MADVAVKVPVSKLRYFRTDQNAGLRVPTFVHQDDCTLNTYVGFTPVDVKHEGYIVRVGYLETDNEDVIKKVLSVAGVQEIDKAEYDKR